MNSDRSSTVTASRGGGLAAGITGFAGIMLAIVSVFQILQGIAAIANDSVFVKATNYVYEFDVTTWGWIHLFMGVVGLAVGVAILAQQTVGYLGGLGIAGISAVTNFAWLPYYPVWSLLIITFNVLVIWALCRQISGDRVDEDYYARNELSGGYGESQAGHGGGEQH
jgi:hypothetical protein